MSDDPHLDALRQRQAAFEAKQHHARRHPLFDHAHAANPAMKAAMDLVGGVLAGVGLGWLADQGFALLHIKTNPWGVVAGTLAGFALGMVAAASTAQRAAQQAAQRAGQASPSDDMAPAEDVDDDDDRRPLGGF